MHLTKHQGAMHSAHYYTFTLLFSGIKPKSWSTAAVETAYSVSTYLMYKGTVVFACLAFIYI